MTCSWAMQEEKPKKQWMRPTVGYLDLILLGSAFFDKYAQLKFAYQ